MVEFVAVDPKDIGAVEQTRKGRISWPILKMFIESGIYIAKIDRNTVKDCRNPTASHLNMLLRSYLSRHPEVPIKIMMMEKEIYLKRLDIDKDGKPVDGWQKQQEKGIIGEPKDLSDDIIEAHRS